MFRWKMFRADECLRMCNKFSFVFPFSFQISQAQINILISILRILFSLSLRFLLKNWLITSIIMVIFHRLYIFSITTTRAVIDFH